MMKLFQKEMMDNLQWLQEWTQRLQQQMWKYQLWETECYDMMAHMKQQKLENQINLDKITPQKALFVIAKENNGSQKQRL